MPRKRKNVLWSFHLSCQVYRGQAASCHFSLGLYTLLALLVFKEIQPNLQMEILSFLSVPNQQAR